MNESHKSLGLFVVLTQLKHQMCLRKSLKAGYLTLRETLQQNCKKQHLPLSLRSIKRFSTKYLVSKRYFTEGQNQFSFTTRREKTGTAALIL